MTILEIRTEKSKRPSLKEAQKFVDGLVQLVPLPNGDQLLCNEEGRLMDLPINAQATTEYGKDICSGLLVGNVMILKDEARWR